MSENYTPKQNTYKELGMFRVWCQKVLPLVYDDSLSYYELLCKVVNYLNETISNVNAMGEDVTNLYSAFTKYQNAVNEDFVTFTNGVTELYTNLKNFVDNYFNNLDVQNEVNIKLDIMASDGSLSELIEPLFDAYKATIDGIILKHDSDINVLKSRMNSFTSLQSGSTTGDAELIDIRVAHNGVTYETGGEAVRTQCGDLDSALYETNKDIVDLSLDTIGKFVLFDETKLRNGKYSTTEMGVIESVDTNQYKCIKINARELYYNSFISHEYTGKDYFHIEVISCDVNDNKLAQTSWIYKGNLNQFIADFTSISKSIIGVHTLYFNFAFKTLQGGGDIVTFPSDFKCEVYYIEREQYGQNVLFTETDLQNGAIVGDVNLDVTLADSNEFKTIVFPVKSLIDELFIEHSNSENLNLMVVACAYNSSNIKIGISGWVHKVSGSRLCGSYTNFVTDFHDVDKVSITFAFTPTTDIADRVQLPKDFTIKAFFKVYASLVERLNALETNINDGGFDAIVDITGKGDYTSVVEAVANVREGGCILIKPGVYDGTIQAFTKRINLIGTDKDKCVLRSTDGRYDYPPINASCGYLERLTLLHEYIDGVSHEIDSGTVGGYALHCENEYGVGKSLTLVNCKLVSDFFPAMGVGLRKDFHLNLENCELENRQVSGRGKYTTTDNTETNGSLGALYFHDSVGEQGDHYVSVKNCVMKSTLGNTMTAYMATGGNNKVHCEFVGNVLHDKVNGYANNIFHRNNPFGDNGNFELEIGFGNSNSELNK